MQIHTLKLPYSREFEAVVGVSGSVSLYGLAGAHLRNVQRRLSKGAWASCPHSFGLPISEMRPIGWASH